MKKIKISLYAVVGDDKDIKLLTDRIKEGLSETERSKWNSTIKSTVLQNTDRSSGIFKAGQVYRVHDIKDKPKYLLLTAAGYVYIKAILITENVLEKIKSTPVEDSSFGELANNLKYYVYYYRFFEGNIVCYYGHYCSIVKIDFDESIDPESYISLDLEYKETIDDEKLASII